MSTQHTPGPWKATYWHDEDTDQGGWDISVNGHLLPLCDMETDGSDDIEANARLISAAPDLLEALKGLLMHPLGAFENEAARAAIAKVKGETA